MEIYGNIYSSRNRIMDYFDVILSDCISSSSIVSVWT